jgi:hypothetical protein
MPARDHDELLTAAELEASLDERRGLASAELEAAEHVEADVRVAAVRADRIAEVAEAATHVDELANS